MKENIIYLRTSTEEQNPQNQLKDCVGLVGSLGIIDYEVLEEQESAFKGDNRPVFNSLLDEMQKGKIKILIVWDYDRLYRNRLKFVDFIRAYTKMGIKIYSFRQQWFKSISDVPSPWNDIVGGLLIDVLGWMAEDESKKRSERIRNAVRKEEGVSTKSYKGNKWGRKEKLSKENKEEIVRLYAEHKSLHKTAEAYNLLHKPHITYGTVYNIIKK